MTSGVIVRNAALDTLRAGKVALGAGIRFARTIDIAKAMRVAGYDWLFIDQEHATTPEDIVVQIAQAAFDVGIAPLVRIPIGGFASATRMLDCGVMGILVPHVETADETREIVRRLRFPPMGTRSVGLPRHQLNYAPVPTRDAAPALNASTLIGVMLESPEAIERADEIAAVPGVDVVMIGTNDLCATMGIPSEFGHARVVAAYETVIAASRKHGKFPGMGGIADKHLSTRYIQMGMRFILSGQDWGFLMEAATARAKFLRGIDVEGQKTK